VALALAAALAALGAVGASACDGCGGDAAAIAELVRAEGDVQADPSGEPVAFTRAEPGHRFALGDAVRTGVRSTAELTLRGGGRLHVDPESVVRFSASPGTTDAVRVGVELGAAEIEADAVDITFGTAVGTARLDRGGRVRLGSGPSSAAGRFEVLVGAAEIQRDDGRVALTAGDRFVIDVGGATVERSGRGRAGDGAAGAPEAGAAGTPAVDGEASGDGGGSEAAAPPADGVSVEVSGRGAEALVDGRWRAIAAGRSSVSRGTELRVAQGTSVLLRGAEGEARVRGAATLRVGGPGEALAVATRGRVELSASAGAELRVDVPGGVIRVRAGAGGESRAEVDVGRDATTVTVAQGTATLATPDGEGRTLGAGERAALSAATGLALGGGAGAGGAGAAGAGAAGAGPGEESAEPSPGVADLTVDLGERPTVHATRLPVAVRVRFGAGCAGDGVLEARRASGGAATRRAGRGAAVVSLAAGAHALTLRCDGRVAGRAEVRVLRDAGVQAAPRRAPRNTVDADGRRYTILYQSVLPAITVRWPRAPAAPSYLLTLTPERGRPVEVRADAPVHAFASGRVGEGTHTIRWQTADGRARSAETTLRVEFDNATPVATVREPGPADPLSGPARVVVLAEEGAAVTVGGGTLTVDAQGRFTGQATVPDGDRCLAVRVAVPQRGVHYFLRCGRP
jgi:hypothetical protein